MPLVFGANADNSIFVGDSLGNAQVGRWSHNPANPPDRCRCWDPDTMMNVNAQGYIIDDGGWLYGCCRRLDCRTRTRYGFRREVHWYMKEAMP